MSEEKSQHENQIQSAQKWRLGLRPRPWNQEFRGQGREGSYAAELISLSFHVAPGESSPPSSFWQLSLALVPFLFKASNQSVLNH